MRWQGGLVKLGDFGLATGLATTVSDTSTGSTQLVPIRRLDPSRSSTPDGEVSRRGRTTVYAAPELLTGDTPAR